MSTHDSPQAAANSDDHCVVCHKQLGENSGTAGGVRMLCALGYHDVSRFHMNYGQAALLGLELLDERARWFHRERFNHEDVQAIKQQCVFTTHTVTHGSRRTESEFAFRRGQRAVVVQHPMVKARLPT